MRKTRLFFLICFLFSAFCPLRPVWGWTDTENVQFKKANENYRQGHYDEAIKLYNELIARHPAAAFYYNLGNSYFRKHEIGEAILAYERAQLYEPRDPDIDSNLKYVRGLLEYRIEDKRNWYIRAGEEFLDLFREQEIVFLVLAVYFLFLVSWAFALFFRRRSPWGWKRKAFVSLTFLFLILFLMKEVQTRVIRDAVVMAKEAEVRYGPSENDQVAFRLGEGLEVHVMDHREDWSRILLVNGNGGWVKNDQIREVRS